MQASGAGSRCRNAARCALKYASAFSPIRRRAVSSLTRGIFLPTNARASLQAVSRRSPATTYPEILRALSVDDRAGDNQLQRRIYADQSGKTLGSAGAEVKLGVLPARAEHVRAGRTPSLTSAPAEPSVFPD